MPCPHKFLPDVHLDRLDFKPRTLIVGTFNPMWPPANAAQWFYGRIQGAIDNHTTGNHFWAVLPRLYGEASLKAPGAVADWKVFCRRHDIAITDLIACIEDADEQNPAHIEHLATYSDQSIANYFQERTLVPIPELLAAHPTITHVYLTRSVDNGFWGRLWHPVQRYGDAHNIRHQTLLTPSDYARFQQGIYNAAHPEAPLSREDYILMRWQEVWHAL